MTLYCTTCRSMKDYETEQAFVLSASLFYFMYLDGALVREELELDERELRLPYLSVRMVLCVCVCVCVHARVCVRRAQFCYCSKRYLSSFLSFSKFVLDCFGKLKTVLEISLSLIFRLGFLHMHSIYFWSVNHWANVFFPYPLLYLAIPTLTSTPSSPLNFDL